MRFFLITVLVTLLHVAISVVLFFVMLSGVQFGSPELSSDVKWAETAFSVWNCCPVAVSQYLELHDFNALRTVTNATKGISDTLFVIWPLIVGSIVAAADFFFRFTRRRGQAQAGG